MFEITPTILYLLCELLLVSLSSSLSDAFLLVAVLAWREVGLGTATTLALAAAPCRDDGFLGAGVAVASDPDSSNSTAAVAAPPDKGFAAWPLRAEEQWR